MKMGSGPHLSVRLGSIGGCCGAEHDSDGRKLYSTRGSWKVIVVKDANFDTNGLVKRVRVTSIDINHVLIVIRHGDA